jgi:D-proline reductase (dithiol) PrdB
LFAISMKKKGIACMADSQSREPDLSKPEPLSLKAFAASLYHAERADNSFKFLHNFSEEELARFLQGLLLQVGDAIDDGNTDTLAQFVQQGQVAAYAPTQTAAPFRPDFPDSPFAPMRTPLREATVALFSSGAIYRDDQDPYYPAELTYEQAVRDVRKATERFPSLRVIPAETPEERLRVGHVAYDIRAAQKDINVIFPLTRFRELAQEGSIGALAQRNYSYHGLTNIPRLMQESAPQWARMLKDDGVDAVFLTAG